MDHDPSQPSYPIVLLGLIAGFIVATILSLGALVWTAFTGHLPQAMAALVVLAVSLAGLALMMKIAVTYQKQPGHFDRR